MKAEKIQIPSENGPPVSKPKSELRGINPDNIYAQLRKFRARIERIEEVNSTLRRDFNRIEKAMSRAKPLPSEIPGNGEKKELHPALFG